MNWYKISQIEDYFLSNGECDGLTVRSEVPNTSSISSSLNKWEEVSGIRNIPIEQFNLTGKSYSVSEDKRIEALTEQIRLSKEINPLIVVKDRDGLYILEGSHRADALFRLGIRYIPALIVIDKDEN
jgi:hypothetical protein